MLLVQDSGNRIGIFWEKTQVKFSIAVLHHASQRPGGIDSPFGLIDCAAVPSDTSRMTFVTLIFCNQLFAHLEISVFEKWVLLRR